AHAEEGSGVIAHGLFELGAESRRAHDVRREHGMAAVPLEAVAPDEAGLAVLQVAEPRDVEPARAAVIQGVRLPDELLHQTGDAGAHHLVRAGVPRGPPRVPEA